MRIKLIVLLVAGLLLAACGTRGPAYKDINTNQQAPAASAGGEGAAGQAPPSNPNPAPAGGTASPAPQPPQAFRMPAFMEPGKGYPKDLPNYPDAKIINVQYGPVETNETFSVSLLTADSMDKISAFYDKVVKSNGWTVTSRVVDPEYCEWILKKADDNDAKVTVRKDKQSPRIYIIAGRTSKQSQPAPPKPQS